MNLNETGSVQKGGAASSLAGIGPRRSPMIAAMDNNFSVEDQSIINQIHQNQINSQSQRSTDLNATPGQYGQTSNHRTDT